MYFEKIIESLAAIPISYSIWDGDRDFVYISNEMAKLIGIQTNVVDSYSFVKITAPMLGQFLKIASEKVLIKGKYTELINNRSITLTYNRGTNIYLLYITSGTAPNNINIENILNTLPIYIWQRDIDLKIKYCNKKYADALETSVASVIQSNLNLPMMKKNKGASLEQLAMASGKPQTIRKHAIINGSRRLLELTEVPMTSKSQQIGYAIDVSEEERLLKEYDKLKIQTNETFNYISVPIAIFDANTNLIFANNAMLKLFDLNEAYVSSSPNFSQILDKLMEERKLMDVDDYQKFKQKLLNYFRDVVAPIYTFTHIPNGKSLNIMISPNYGGGLIFVFEDITEKLTIEREYNALSAVQKETLEHLHEGILVFGMDNRLRMINPSTRNIWTIPFDKNIEDMHIKDFFTISMDTFESDHEKESWISQVINMSEQRKETTGILTFKGKINIDYAYVPLPDGMNLIRFVDITDRAKLEKALVEKTETMQQISNLKSSFIANMSYELKSPINTITGFSEILINQYFGSLNEKQTEYCSSIISSANKLSEMIDILLNLSHIEAGKSKMQYADILISDLFTELINMFVDNINDKKINITTSITASSNTLYIDVNSIKQMLFQMFSMVIKTTQIGGTISLDVIDSQNTPNYVDISIKHTGVGMPPEQLDRIRDLLLNDKDIKNVASSTSDFLLLFANHVTRMHNGKLIVNSKQNEYTEIIFRIPTKISIP